MPAIWEFVPTLDFDWEVLYTPEGGRGDGRFRVCGLLPRPFSAWWDSTPWVRLPIILYCMGLPSLCTQNRRYTFWFTAWFAAFSAPLLLVL